jgi:pyrroloquinoline quinone biosynthesis protein B
VPHRDEYSDTVGFLIRGPRRSLLYVPDSDPWAAWTSSLSDRLAGVDLAFLDGTFFSADELPGRSIESIGHPLITDSMELLEPLVVAGGPSVYFTHLNHTNPALDPRSPERAEIERRGFAVLEDGQRFPL